MLVVADYNFNICVASGTETDPILPSTGCPSILPRVSQLPMITVPPTTLKGHGPCGGVKANAKRREITEGRWLPGAVRSYCFSG